MTHLKSKLQTPNSSIPQTAAIIQLRRVTKTYANGSRGVLDVSLDVPRGDFLFITGASGAGKSPLYQFTTTSQFP
ncbi:MULTISPECIES: hypothetical protein [unclassified Coleofasciculus]|uniref:hypothetical protein n=1 Tax=unclassified Coleofasciculus TaxID=2692782 RepID=UPI00187EEBC3|nr:MULTISPECIES: hypothetical protein [unclassified Coleofasciculus]MBE9150489.1 hypothetical protein [Coleofasciculus sp. LEGE 07092]